MTDDFSKYPPSVAEIRSDRTNAAKDWSPRDALIRALRDLDAGTIKPDAIVIMWATGTEGELGWVAASPNKMLTLGLVSRAVHTIQTTYDG